MPLLGLWVLPPAVGIQGVPSPLISLAAPGPAGQGHSLPLFLQATLAENCSPAADQQPDFDRTQADLCKWMVTMQCSVNRLFVNRKICCFEESWYFSGFFSSFPIFLFNILWKNEVKALKKILLIWTAIFMWTLLTMMKKMEQKELKGNIQTTVLLLSVGSIWKMWKYYIYVNISCWKRFFYFNQLDLCFEQFTLWLQDFQVSRIQKAFMSNSLWIVLSFS